MFVQVYPLKNERHAGSVEFKDQVGTLHHFLGTLSFSTTSQWDFHGQESLRKALGLNRCKWGLVTEWFPAVQLEDCSIRHIIWVLFVRTLWRYTRCHISFRSSLFFWSCVKPWRNHRGTSHAMKFTPCMLSSHELIWLTIVNTIGTVCVRFVNQIATQP